MKLPWKKMRYNKQTGKPTGNLTDSQAVCQHQSATALHFGSSYVRRTEMLPIGGPRQTDRLIDTPTECGNKSFCGIAAVHWCVRRISP